MDIQSAEDPAMGSNDQIELAHRLTKSLEDGDVEAVRSAFCPDAVLWHNTDGLTLDLDGLAGSFSSFVADVPKRHIDVHERLNIAGSLFQSHTINCATHDGRAFKLRGCWMLKFERGKIIRLDEYLDGSAFPSALSTED